MPKYAYFDATQPAPQRVIGFLDTDGIYYPNPPPPTDLLELSADQWNARLTGFWEVQAGTLVAIMPPAPTLAQQAAAVIYDGFTITLSGSATLAATLFPTDPSTIRKLADVVTTLAATGAFPGGATTSYPMKDASGVWHTFTAVQYKAVAGAIAAYVAALDLIIDGNPMGATTLPASSASLTV